MCKGRGGVCVAATRRRAGDAGGFELWRGGETSTVEAGVVGPVVVEKGTVGRREHR